MSGNPAWERVIKATVAKESPAGSALVEEIEQELRGPLSTNVGDLLQRARDRLSELEGDVHHLATEWTIAKRELAEARADGEKAGWLAQMVIDKLGGTNDLPAWVRQSAKYYSDALKRGDELESALQSAQADAERYRWLREQFDSFHDGQYPGYNFRCTLLLKPDKHIPTVDAAIDAALAAERKETEG